MNKPRSDILEAFDLTSNNAVIRAPGRQFPGILIQGDSLSILVNSVRNLCSLIEGASEEARDEVAFLLDELEAKQRHYERVLLDHGFTLPYAK